MRIPDSKQFLNKLRSNPRQFEDKNLLREIILNNQNSPLFLQVLQVARELLAENRISRDVLSALFIVNVTQPGIFNRLMGWRRSETLIETILKVIIQQPENKLAEENWQQKTFTSCFINSALPSSANLKRFLIYSSPELITVFFEQLNAVIRKGFLSRENCDQIFNSLIRHDFLNDAVKNNRVSVLRGLKNIGYNLSAAFLRAGADSSLHALAGSASIATVNFLLDEKININSKDHHSRTTIFYIIQNIERMSHVIGTDLIFFRPHYELWLCNDFDFLERRDSFSSKKNFMHDNINKVLFLLENGAKMTADEAEKLNSSLAVFSAKYSKNKEKYSEISFAKLQYLRGFVKEKQGKAQQAFYHFIEAATQGDRSSSLKAGEYFLLNKKEEDALIWYQQAIHNSAAPKPTLLQLIGLEKMIQLVHGINIRKTETNEDLHQYYACIIRELKTVDCSKETISVDGLLQLAHLVVEHDDSPTQYKFALQLACAAFDKAGAEGKNQLVQTAQQDIQHVMSRVLDKLPAAEAKYHAGIDFMLFASDCGVAHYYKLCLELAKLNLDLEKEDSDQRVHYWIEMAAILGHKDVSIFSNNLGEEIEIELRNINSVIPSVSRYALKPLGVLGVI